ncbi:hypothetical protein J8F10_22385 [Gemmata sp. G18]|uniref:Uncharacterized protein n=1 Tax=Gemmata palustris TaxID=2822762 RepID=A0ABS5BWH9_9BACT|nr:hypothetical protein [Gemmata palustris]MBP3958013.1 hypothetical protein [Gemmata palustris]
MRSDAVLWAANGLLRATGTRATGSITTRRHERLPKLEARLRGAGQDTAILREALAERPAGPGDRAVVAGDRGPGPGGGRAHRVGVLGDPHARRAGACSRGRARGPGNNRSEVYTSARAFTGAYTVSVKQAFGRPLGERASQGDPVPGDRAESVDLLDVPVGAGVEVKLAGGSRPWCPWPRRWAPGATCAGPGGFGPIGPGWRVRDRGERTFGPGDELGRGRGAPGVGPGRDARAGISSGAADIRATYQLNPDRKSFRVSVTPVFAAGTRAIALPTVPLLPGGEK